MKYADMSTDSQEIDGRVVEIVYHNGFDREGMAKLEQLKTEKQTTGPSNWFTLFRTTR